MNPRDENSLPFSVPSASDDQNLDMSPLPMNWNMLPQDIRVSALLSTLQATSTLLGQSYSQPFVQSSAVSSPLPELPLVVSLSEHVSIGSDLASASMNIDPLPHSEPGRDDKAVAGHLHKGAKRTSSHLQNVSLFNSHSKKPRLANDSQAEQREDMPLQSSAISTSKAKPKSKPKPVVSAAEVKEDKTASEKQNKLTVTYNGSKKKREIFYCIMDKEMLLRAEHVIMCLSSRAQDEIVKDIRSHSTAKKILFRRGLSKKAYCFTAKQAFDMLESIIENKDGRHHRDLEVEQANARELRNQLFQCEVQYKPVFVDNVEHITLKLPIWFDRKLVKKLLPVSLLWEQALLKQEQLKQKNMVVTYENSKQRKEVSYRIIDGEIVLRADQFIMCFSFKTIAGASRYIRSCQLNKRVLFKCSNSGASTNSVHCFTAQTAFDMLGLVIEGTRRIFKINSKLVVANAKALRHQLFQHEVKDGKIQYKPVFVNVENIALELPAHFERAAKKSGAEAKSNGSVSSGSAVDRSAQPVSAVAESFFNSSAAKPTTSVAVSRSVFDLTG